MQAWLPVAEQLQQQTLLDDLRWRILRGRHAAGQIAAAAAFGESYLETASMFPKYGDWIEYAWLLRLSGQAPRALALVDKWLRDLPPDKTLHRLGLRLERCRILAALDRWEEAEAELDAAGASESPDYYEYAPAALLRGFFLERAGRLDEARAAWREGRFVVWSRQQPEPASALPRSEADNGFRLLHRAMLDSLSGELTDAEADALIADVFRHLGYGYLHGMLRIPPAVFREVLQTERGREVARQAALRSISFAEILRRGGALMALATFRQGAFPEGLTDEEEELLWRLSLALYDGYRDRRLEIDREGFAILALWKRLGGFPAWTAVASQLSPEIRGPTAYVLAHRYWNAPQPDRDTARRFLEAALQDAPPDSALEKLARENLEQW
jgi:hypothetical protein